jgi:hypothetical protein
MLKLPPRPALRLPTRSQLQSMLRWNRRSLLLPMILVALAFHGALLAVPLPPKDEPKTADDQQNPIQVTQIPTEKPALAETQASPKVSIPPMGSTSVSGTTASGATASSASDSASSTGETSSSDSDSGEAADSGSADSSETQASKTSTASKSSGAKTASTTAKKSTSDDSGETPPETKDSAEQAAESKSSDSKPSGDQTADASASAAPVPFEQAKGSPLTTVSFAEFPHYQPSTADCFGLGFGENCRVVEKVAIADLASHFRKELAAKAFQADLVTDTPTHKVFKVTKDSKTLFLNIWQGKQALSYALSDQVLKQSPEEMQKPEIKSEAAPPSESQSLHMRPESHGKPSPSSEELGTLSVDQILSMLFDTLR